MRKANQDGRRGFAREAVVAATVAVAILSAAMSFGQPPGGPAGSQAPYVMPPLGQALFEHLHNKIIHFPIALGLAAALMVLVARRKPELEPVAFWMVWFAVLSTLAAYFSGLAQSGEFLRRPKRWLMETHMRWGIGLALAECVWLLALLRQRTRWLAAGMSFVVAALVLVTAFLGGLLGHGRGAGPPPTSAPVAAPAAAPADSTAARADSTARVP